MFVQAQAQDAGETEEPGYYLTAAPVQAAQTNMVDCTHALEVQQDNAEYDRTLIPSMMCFRDSPVSLGPD